MVILIPKLFGKMVTPGPVYIMETGKIMQVHGKKFKQLMGEGRDKRGAPIQTFVNSDDQKNEMLSIINRRTATYVKNGLGKIDIITAGVIEIL